MKNYKINVVIPNWNGEKWLDKCINSIYSNKLEGLIITIVDNNSSDKSISIIEKYKQINLIKNEKNYGFATAINQGINDIESEYILILNNDAWIDSKFINEALIEIREKNIDILGFKEAEFDNNNLLYLGDENYYTIDIFGYHTGTRNKNKCMYLCGVCILIKREIYINTGGFDNKFFMYLEEVDWFWRLNLYDKKYEQSEKLYVHHRKHGSTGNKLLNEKRFIWRNSNTLRMLLKNYSLVTLLIIIPSYLLITIIEIIFFILKKEYIIALSYLKGTLNVVLDIKYIYKSRKKIQNERRVSDISILKKMYFGSAKLKQLLKNI